MFDVFHDVLVELCVLLSLSDDDREKFLVLRLKCLELVFLVQTAEGIVDRASHHFYDQRAERLVEALQSAKFRVKF